MMKGVQTLIICKIRLANNVCLILSVITEGMEVSGNSSFVVKADLFSKASPNRQPFDLITPQCC